MIEGNMASVSGTNPTDNTANIPQWKRDLIQRRRQQNRALANNITGVYSTVAAIADTNLISDVDSTINSNENQCIDASNLTQETSRDDAVQVTPLSVQNELTCGAVITTATTMGCELNDCSPAGNIKSSVACNMHLEANGSLCPTSEDNTPKTLKNHSMERNMEFDPCDINSRNYVGKKYNNDEVTDEFTRQTVQNTKNVKNETGVCIREYRRSRIDTINKNVMDNNRGIMDECESDSSEELQYGPGIVNKLKSKYLNLTLREMNKNRTSVQRFRRAASLEDLLDCDHDADKSIRKFTKKTTPPGIAVKTERYRNLSRGNDSMKRARSVEALMRYQSDDDKHLTNKLLGLRQEPVNDHIVLIDRTTVNIENRLMKSERPKALNKPKRIKPLLADTERPPPDLVKTTMRIFEGSVKKLKPKGDVAVKVATFKTINDTFKAQTIRKVVPKPPLQPKPFINGNLKVSGLSKKNTLPLKSTGDSDRPESPEKYRNNGVASDSIVQSVSSVVSKFQQIEKSASPEPTHNKFKFSPAPSPEPLSAKVKSSTEGIAKAVPIVLCPLVSKKDLLHSNSILPGQISLSPSSETTIQTLATEKSESLLMIQAEKESNSVIEITENRSQQQDIIVPLDETKTEETDKLISPLETYVSKDELSDEPTSVSKSMDFTFENESLLLSKSYQSGIENSTPSNGITDVQSVELKSSVSSSNISMDSDSTDSSNEKISRIQERPESEMMKEIKVELPPINDKPIGAISSLGLIKTSTMPPYPPGKEAKLIKSQKSNTLPIQKQIGIIRPLVSMKTQVPQQNLSNRELEKNLINRVKNIEQPTKVVVSIKSTDEIQPVKKTSSSGASSGECGGSSGGSGGGLWDTKPWNQQNNTMVFNFSNRKDVPDYIENDGLIIRRKREKPKVGDGGIIVLDATLDASTTDDGDWEMSRGPPSPCDVLFTNDNVLINGRSNLIRTPRNHKNRIQFNDDATRTFEYPSEASMLEDDAGSCLGGETSAAGCNDDYQSSGVINKSTCSMSTTGSTASPILGGGGLASYTPSKVDLTSDGFELGVTRSVHPSTCPPGQQWESEETATDGKVKDQDLTDHDAAAWGAEATADLLY